jgi:hypothetical protein
MHPLVYPADGTLRRAFQLKRFQLAELRFKPHMFVPKCLHIKLLLPMFFARFEKSQILSST